MKMLHKQIDTIPTPIKTPLKQILRNNLINIAVRLPLKKFLTGFSNGSIKYFLLRMPVVGKFRVKLPDMNSLIIDTPGPNIDPIARGLFWWGFKSYESETAGLFYELAKKSATTFDIGANIGYFSLLASVANRESSIVAFEPVPELFRYLKGNIHANHVANVTAVSAAVTSYDGYVILYINEEASSSIEKNYREAIAEIEVPAVTLDSYVRQNEIHKVDLIKIDVETGEPGVFEGMQHVLKRDEPEIICEVLGDATERFLNRFLSDYGYRFYWITNDGLLRRDIIVHDDKYRYLNYLFTKNNINDLV